MRILAFAAFLGVLVVYGALYRRVRRRRVGAGAVGMFSDLLNKDRLNAVEVIVEDRAAAKDPETQDDLPPDETVGKS